MPSRFYTAATSLQQEHPRHPIKETTTGIGYTTDHRRAATVLQGSLATAEMRPQAQGDSTHFNNRSKQRPLAQGDSTLIQESKYVIEEERGGL